MNWIIFSNYGKNKRDNCYLLALPHKTLAFILKPAGLAVPTTQPILIDVLLRYFYLLGIHGTFQL